MHADSLLAESPDAAAAAGGALAERLAALYAQRIGQRLLLPGARLPSVRACARLHGVSPSTVVAAYDRLQAQGLAEAQRQRGYFVRGRAAAEPRAKAASAQATLPPPVDATALIRACSSAAAAAAARAWARCPRPGWMRNCCSARCAVPRRPRAAAPACATAIRRVMARCAAHWPSACRPIWACRPASIRSSPRWAPRRAWTSWPARWWRQGTPCWSTSPAGRWSTRASRTWACACCRCRAVRRGRIWR